MKTPREVYLERKIEQLESRLPPNMTQDFYGWAKDEVKLENNHPSIINVFKQASISIHRNYCPIIIGRTYTEKGKEFEMSIYAEQFLLKDQTFNYLGMLLNEGIKNLSHELEKSLEIYERNK